MFQRDRERGRNGASHYQHWDACRSRLGRRSARCYQLPLHELAHSLARWAAGHGPAWRSAARALGLIRAQAAGQGYSSKDFDPELWVIINSLPEPADGQPRFAHEGINLRCGAGGGTRGGTSRGRGSGSRLRLFVCACMPPIRIRVARDANNLHVRCLDCNTIFHSPTAGTPDQEPSLVAYAAPSAVETA
jgi:hypothetical protein